MSTLAVFYDEIWLPYPYELHRLLPYHGGLLDVISMDDDVLSYLRNAEDIYVEQRSQWETLFRQGIIKTLEPLFASEIPLYLLDQDTPHRLSKFQERLKNFSSHGAHGNLIISPQQIASGSFALAIHSLYVFKSRPELFISDPSDTHTSRLAGFLVDAIFQLKIPQLKTLNAEQILEVRYKLRNFKEGFTDYVIRLTNDVEALLQSGETSELVAAQKIAERYFETDYRQIRRQIEPLKIMFGGSILAAGGAFFLTAAVQTTPALLAALAVLYGTVLKDFWQTEVADSANDKQAFKFIAKLESEVSKRIP